MDWRNNIWVGIGAAGLLVVGIFFLVWYVGGGEDKVAAGAVGLKFKCDTCGEVFVIKQTEFDDFDTYMAYFSKYGEVVVCRECGAEDAWQVYLCRECGDKYYKYEPSQGVSEFLRCPEGHNIPTDDS